MPRAMLKAALAAVIKAIVFSGSFLFAQYIMAYYGPAVLGQLVTILSIITLASIVYSKGYTILLKRLVAEGGDTPARIFQGLNTQLLINGRRWLVFLALVVGGALWVTLTLGWQSAQIFFLLCAFIILISTVTLRGTYLRAIGRPLASSIYEIGALYILFFVVDQTLRFLGFGSGISSLVVMSLLSLAILGFAVLRAIPHRHHMVGSDPRQTTTMVNGILIFLFRQGLPLILAVLVSIEDVGLFRLEERIAFMLLFFNVLFETFFTKRYITALQEGRLNVLFRKGLVFILGLAGMCAAALYLLLPYAIAYTPLDFAPNQDFLWLTFMGGVFLVGITYLSWMMQIQGAFLDSRRVLLITVISFLIAVAVFYGPFGYVGIRWAYFCSTSMGLIAAGILYLRIERRVATAASE